MACIPRYSRNLFGPLHFTRAASTSRFAEGDRVYVKTKSRELVSGPLRKDGKINLPNSILPHEKILGQLPGTEVRASNFSAYRVTHPSLEQYVNLTPRKVTPIYAHDASFIVSQLDIHVPTYGSHDASSPPLEILEAGTGHGSLTLHLARAIHAANPLPPSTPLPFQRQLEKSGKVTVVARDEAWKAYYASRKAIIHTTDVSPSFSVHAERIVHGFRKGIYAPHVEYYISPVKDWVTSQSQLRRTLQTDNQDQPLEPYISYALLDLPSVHAQLSDVAPIMRPNGLVAIFTASVTQIGDCVREIQEKSLPFKSVKTLELGTGISSGRVWDVRLASVRARSTDRDRLIGEQKQKMKKTKKSAEAAISEGESSNEDTACIASSDIVPEEEGEQGEEDPQVMVCRPKVGERIVGGGFLGLFRKV